MSSPYVGEIRMFAGTFEPVGWAFCNGQLIPISENETLFLLIGTTYGGDGQNDFALPNLQSRLPIHMGQGSGLSNRLIGEQGGTETVTLTVNEIPAHSHVPVGNSGNGTSTDPTGNVWAAQPALLQYTVAGTSNVNLPANTIAATGGSQPHDNMNPYLCVTFIISLYGVYPSPT